MTTSPEGRIFIETMEGIRFAAYRDGGGTFTIGVGHTKGVKAGDTCTPEQADQWLSEDLAEAEHDVNRFVTVPLNQNQFDALVSFTFNLGWISLEHSTLLKLLNQGDTQGASNQFLSWIRIKGVMSPGLLNRRTAERVLFMTPQPISSEPASAEKGDSQ